MPDEPERRRPDLLPVLVLGGLALLMLAGWLLFPLLQKSISHADCVAAGYTNCNGQRP